MHLHFEDPDMKTNTLQSVWSPEQHKETLFIEHLELLFWQQKKTDSLYL